MSDLAADAIPWGYLWICGNFLLFVTAFLAALYLNFNFNTVIVGSIYLLPLIPLGLTPENAGRFYIVSFHNLVFGMIELALFAITVRKTDITFDKEHLRQLCGHVLPVAAALVGLSFASRATAAPVAASELGWIMAVFLTGVVLRVWAVYQIGVVSFKFDIVIRDEQKLKTDQLYGRLRHPSYTGMMLVILAYALTAHDWVLASLGMISAWFGFQFRIYHEEKALEERFGEDFRKYREKTGMWFPRLGS